MSTEESLSGTTKPVPSESPHWRRYQLDPRPGGTQLVIASLIPPQSDVLDVGCASGYLGEVIRDRGHRVWGLDASAEAVSHISPGVYEDVVCADLVTAPALPWDCEF